MIIVHHLNNSRSQRVLWLLEELGVPYEVRRYQRDAATMLAPPELKTIHALGKSPVIADGGTVVAETGAIVEYLVDRYGNGRLVPAAGSPEKLRYTYWLHYAEGSLMPPLLLRLVFSRLASAPMPFFARPIARRIAAKVRSSFIDPQLRLHFDFVENELGRSTWFAGEMFTAADVQLSFPIEAAAARGVVDSSRPRLTSFLARIHERPAYRRALERGGAYAILS
jgi:glutathione S-transferase